MTRVAAWIAGGVAILACRHALACGAPFGDNVRVDPNQDIIVAWKAGTETYVFQPTFCGTAADFGLILPVPNQLTKNPELVAQKAFTVAAALSEPTKVPVPSKSGIGCGAADTASRAADNDGPTVVASGSVGFLDWVQLKATGLSSFTDWLAANGYPYSDSATAAFSYYVTEGWYFLAFKISQQIAAGESVCKALGPVSVTFPADAPVVPVRMGSISSTVSSWGRFAWRVFGITEGGIQLHGGALRYSGAISDGDLASFDGLAASGDRLTRLHLEFYGGSTSLDDKLGTTRASDFRAVEYVPESDSSCRVGWASSIGRRGHLGFGLVGLGFLGLLLWRRGRRKLPPCL